MDFDSFCIFIHDEINKFNDFTGDEQMHITDKEIRKKIIFSNKKNYKYFRNIFVNYFKNFNIPYYSTKDIVNIIKEISSDNFNKENKIFKNFLKLFIKPTSFQDFNCIIIGCPDSTDIDVVVLVDTKYNIETIQINKNDIVEKLKLICIYEIENIEEKKIDINIIHINNKKVIKSVKGSIKTIQGIIYYTQHFHNKKEYFIDVEPPQSYNIEDRIIPPITYILYNINIFCDKSICENLRNEKIYAINNDEKTKIDFVLKNNIFEKIISNLNEINEKNMDYIKGLFVKISTIILIQNNLSENLEYYTKKGIASLLNKIYPNSYEYAIHYLFRGKLGIFNKSFLKIIFDNFIQILKDYRFKYDLEWFNYPIKRNIITYIDTKIQELFWKSPMVPSEDFIEYFYSISSGINIEEHFRIPFTKSEEFEFNQKNKIIFVEQRSREWFEMRKIYPPNNVEKNDKIYYCNNDKNSIKDNFHFIVGSIGEQYVMFNVEWSKIFPNYKFISVGMLIDPIKKYGISPDGILVNSNTNEIIPIEIKCIRNKQSKFSRNTMREIKIAFEQLKTIKKIINCYIGIIAFLYIDTFEFEYCIIKI
jgi:hypothetical protein